ncbi:hypothetical protein N7462_009291 [Penicillium macrosclerotiorum]|uniref:uncharacterized protein n=1 Tax=Penicillium macrosclerotiorum TaxID=303699 RepID=UPI002546C533|nr:uncharacterized protein N7462_009291 [Penicillium macrosclerotiorum]KAJ5673852.1 hypothetical protein N7462_009291 [Penicillium macrosclerotiorum]
MSPEFVFTFAAVYVTMVLLLNQFNAGRGYQPWALSKSPIFKPLVTIHNALLALFSAWSLCGMLYVPFVLWPSIATDLDVSYPARAVEFLCKANSKDYKILNNLSISEAGGTYMSWLFYMSKFYEVMDTLIILTSGRKSSTLQTFHHAGVMIAGWIGMRYESPMGFIGAILNAAVHTLMVRRHYPLLDSFLLEEIRLYMLIHESLSFQYTYFTLRALGISVPSKFKRTLTKIQIGQFVVGLGIAYLYTFVRYEAPLHVVRKAFNSTSPLVSDSVKRRDHIREGLNDMVTFSCLENRGEGFPVILASLYLLPLTYLFIKFYVHSYTRKMA